MNTRISGVICAAILAFGTMGISAIQPTGAAPDAGRHAVEFQNRHREESSVYLVNALLSRDGMTTVLSQQRDSRQSTAHIEYELTRPASPMVWVSLAGITFVALAAFRRRLGVRPRAFAREAAGVH